jgi:DNA-binding MurR/RpiR family transcriptional regulator
MTAFLWSARDGDSSVGQTIEGALRELSPAEARVAQYILHRESEMVFETGASIARKVGVSEITVSRLLRRLGFRGMAGLKAAIQQDAAAGLLGADVMQQRLFSGDYGEAIRKEAEALLALSETVQTPQWEGMTRLVAGAERVFATGFQTVRGTAEDFARRLALVRPGVQYLSPHDGALAEWIDTTDAASQVLVLIDVVPYSSEAPALARICAERGSGLTVFTDEFNIWAREFTDHIVHIHTNNGLFLESTGTITTALNLLVHSVARLDPDATRRRIGGWRDLVGAVELFTAAKSQP